MNFATCYQKRSIQLLIFHVFLKFGLWGLQTMGGAQNVWDLLTWPCYHILMKSFFKSISVTMPKSNRLETNFISFYFSHMSFVKKSDCTLSASNGSVNALTAYKMKNIFLLMGIRRWPCIQGFWNLTFFYYIFSKKGVFLVLRRKKIKFHHFWLHPWKDLYGYFCKNLVYPW